MSEDEQLSIASVKGEGFASDLSDNEMKNQQLNRAKVKKSALNQDNGNTFYNNNNNMNQNNLKRPTTPMDFRIVEQQHQQQHQQQQSQKSKQQEMKQNKFNQDPNQIQTGVTHQRFNEWDPYAALRQQQQVQQQQNIDSRQKSPLKSKNQQNSSNFAHSFLNTDSSPRQSSGRNAQTGVAIQNGGPLSNQKLQQMSPQHQQQQQQQQQLNQNKEIDLNSSSNNLDLIISGQRLGGQRKDLSPTNTPRESTNQIGQQQLQQSQLQQQQQQQQRPFTRRLQPLDKVNMEPVLNSNSNQQDSQFISRLKT